jgi:hypothetical protein
MGLEGRNRRAEVVVPRDVGEHVHTDRRTRDRVRLFFWAVLTVVCLVAVLVARQQQTQGLQRKADAAQERAVRFTQNVLVDRLDARRVSRPIERSGYDELLAELKHGLFNDQRVVRVRVWRADGLLVFTTDHRSEIGVTTSDDANLRSALRGDLVSVVATQSFAADDSTTSKATTLFSTLIPLRTSDKAEVFGVVQIDNDYSIMVDASSHPWQQMQIAFAIVALLCLIMAIVSFVWSHRKEEAPKEDSGFGPSRREVRAVARDEKKAVAAEGEAEKLRERVKELEGKTKSIAEQQVELEKLRGRVAEYEQSPARAETADPAELAQLRVHATQLEEQARGSESRVAQLQSRVTEMEAQLRVTTDQLRMAQKRVEEAPATPEAVPAPLQAQLDAAGETEQLLRAELEAARAEIHRVEQEREAIESAHSEEVRSQMGQLDEVRAQARLAEEERQRILVEAVKSATAQPAVSADAEARLRELTQQLERSEAERAMLRAGRPETVYEARNRQLEDDLAQVREQLVVAEGRARSGDASKAGVDPSVIAALEERISAAEERAHEAERRLDEAKPRRSRSRASQRTNGNGDGDGSGEVAQAEVEPEAEPDDAALEKAKEDGSELRSRLVRSTDARRRGISTPTTVPTPGPKRR